MRLTYAEDVAVDGAVFGRPGGDASLRQSIMQAAPLNASPSPATPAELVENPTLQSYYRMYAAASEALRLEKDPLRRLELEKCRAFADRVISEIEQTDASAGPPAPAPPAVDAAAGAQQAGSPGAPSVPPPPPGQLPAPAGGTSLPVTPAA